MKTLQKHTELFHKTTGQMYYFVQALSEQELLCVLPITIDYGDDEFDQEPSDMLAIVKVAEVSEQKPNILIPKYLDEHIERATSELQRKRSEIKDIKEQISKAKTDLYQEKNAQRKRMENFPEHVKNQLELVIDHLEGVDLYVSALNFNAVVTKKMSELGENDSMRMVALHRNFKDAHCNVVDYDWCIHKYSDDSGSHEYCFVGRTMDEIKEKWASLASKRGTSMFNDNKIIALVESGFVTDKRFVERAEKCKEERKAQQKITEERKVNQLKSEAEKLGFKITK